MIQPTDWTNSIARLVALAERCASEGQMNLNKLVEAAVYAEIRRAGWRYRPRVTLERLIPELEASLQGLKQDDLSPELIAALEAGLKAGLRALSEGSRSDLLIEEAPDAFVCRTCGHVALGSPPGHCPDCGSWPGRFRKFVALFNGDNQEPINPVETLALLSQNAQDLEWLVKDLSEEEMARAPLGSDWSIRDHIAHFYDTQEMLDTRVELMLEQDDPELVAIAVYELATEEKRHPTTAQAILAEFRRKRSQCVAHLEALPLKALWRTGRHLEFGRLTILRQAAYLAQHEQTHLPEIEALCHQVKST